MQPTLSRFIGIPKASSTSTAWRKELSSDESGDDDDEKQQSEEDCSESFVRLA